MGPNRPLSIAGLAQSAAAGGGATSTIDDVPDGAVGGHAQPVGEQVVKSDAGACGRLNPIFYAHAVVKHTVHAHPQRFVLRHVRRYLVRGVAQHAIVLPGALVGRVVGKLRLVHVGGAIVAVPQGLVFLKVLAK